MQHQVIYLSDADVRSMLEISSAVRAVEADFKRQAEPDSLVLGVPLAWATDDRKLGFRWRLKTAVIRGVPIAGVRVTGYKIDADGVGSGGERAATRYVILSDPRTSTPLAIIDEHSSFSVRTAASVVVAAKYLAKPASKVVGIIGVGNIGRTTLAGLAGLFGIEQVRATSVRPESRERFAAEMSRELGLEVVAKAGYEEVCRGADIIVCGTPSVEPFLRYDWLADGAFVGAVGLDEVAHDVYARCDRFYVDYDLKTEPHPEHIQDAIDAGAITHERITGELWQVVSGQHPSRRDDREKVLVCTVGLTSQDISIAYELYEQAKAEGRGMRLPF